VGPSQSRQRQHAFTDWQQERHGLRFSLRSPQRLHALIDEVGRSNEPVLIIGQQGNAVLLGEDHWRAIWETLHLVSIPGMRTSILDGMATEVTELSQDALW
jgi:PHD/YefM family antitoxin component YafN of YafNO toxin-antitoxin module